MLHKTLGGMIIMLLRNVLELVKQVAEIDTIDFDDIEVDGSSIKIEGTDYIVYDEDEIREQMDFQIQETASYFNKNFLSGITGLDEEIFKALVDKNKEVYDLIDKTCGLDDFIDECLKVDGAGHFLNSYNGEEYELGDGLSAFNC